MPGRQVDILDGFLVRLTPIDIQTVKHVMIAQSTDYGGAASAEQFYVSVSRGKKSVEIFVVVNPVVKVG